MQSSHKLPTVTTETSSFESTTQTLETHVQNLMAYLDKLKEDKDTATAEAHEEVIVRLTHELGRSALSEMLSLYDVKTDVLSANDQTYRRKYKAPKTYQTALGSVTLERHVYVNRKKGGDGKSICPLELQSGIVEGYWTPMAAKNAAWALAHLTPQEVEHLLLQFGKMDPSRSSLDRLPKALFKQWEAHPVQAHQELLSDEKAPKDAVTISISLDGVMLGMKPPKNLENKEKKRACEWREASCGTLSFFDKEGERLSTIQYGRMPEHKKQSLKKLLQQNVDSIMAERPELNLVYLADGAQDNWCFIEEEMPLGFSLTDFYHVCQYLKLAFNAAYPKAPEKASEKFTHYRRVLRDEANGAVKVLRALRYLAQRDRGAEDISRAVTYFTNNQHRMKYAKAKALHYPIGSGVVEAACKSLVGQRMKRSGMSWHHTGGQSILTLRALVKSQRFERAWESLAKPYRKNLQIHDNVFSLFG